MAIRLLQHRDESGARAVLFAQDEEAWVLQGVTSVYAMAMAAIAQAYRWSTLPGSLRAARSSTLRQSSPRAG